MQLHDQSPPPRSIWKIFIRGLSEQAQTGLLARLPIHEGAVLTDELIQAARRVAKAYDSRLEIRVNPAPTPGGNAVSVTFFDPSKPPQRIIVEARVQESMLVEKPAPACPSQDRPVTGLVQLAVVVAKDGTVMDITPLAGPDTLLDPAVDAVKRWRYRPMLLNGRPVEVQTTVDVSFAPGL